MKIRTTKIRNNQIGHTGFVVGFLDVQKGQPPAPGAVVVMALGLPNGRQIVVHLTPDEADVIGSQLTATALLAGGRPPFLELAEEDFDDDADETRTAGGLIVPRGRA